MLHKATPTTVSALSWCWMDQISAIEIKRLVNRKLFEKAEDLSWWTANVTLLAHELVAFVTGNFSLAGWLKRCEVCGKMSGSVSEGSNWLTCQVYRYWHEDKQEYLDTCASCREEPNVVIVR